MTQPSSSPRPVYLDPSLPLADRVQDLLARLTLDEKISQMRNNCAAIPRLNIPAYNYWNEALHGVARNGRATIFPQAIGMAATWDSALIQQIGSAISDEGRAKYRAALERNGENGIYQGLTFWSPNVNIFRDPRWGRGQETWGEDPHLTGELGAAFVRGLQGDHPRYLKAAACAKHYAVHSGPEKLRHVFNAVVSKRDLHGTYLPAFKKLVIEAKVEAVMGAYNRTLGEPCCASQLLLEQTLRQEWGFQGHVVSDCGALSDFHNGHKVTRDVVESAALALKAGCDMSCICTYDHLGEAIERGLISEADIDRSLARTLATRFKLGMFDPSEMVPYNQISMSVVGCAEHRQLAYEAARKSVVLLKNQDGLLPLGEKVRTALLTGPTAADIEVLLGNYYGLSDSLTTLLEGIVAAAPEGLQIEYRPGVQLQGANANPADWTFHAAAEADVTIACMGLSALMEGEEGDAVLSDENGDRSDIGLPAAQVDLIRRLWLHGARIVLVLTGGSPIAIGELEEMVQAAIFIWYPGQEGGRAVADVLFGKANPSGKLPLTFPRSLAQLPPFEDYDMAGRTYRFASAEPLFPFGFGLSYTRFAYSQLALDQSILAAGQPLTGRFTVTNTGERAGEEVAQLYLSYPQPAPPAPICNLVGFQRLALQPGESRGLEFALTPEQLMLCDDEGQPRLAPGEYRLTVGGCSPGGRGLALGAPQPVSAAFTVS
jgi:beta-glucosidase